MVRFGFEGPRALTAVYHRGWNLLAQAHGATISIPLPTTCFDFDRSGSVAIPDLQDLASRWGDPARYAARYDVAAPTGVIDVHDMMMVVAQWGRRCQGP